ncbi:putative aminohydrolase SsnA [Oscillospiraceae bacterium HV4-5-C5C]|nr:putative aminohydrolase SsnA [Oscillospiraceae bacterium HV4-5-C5C]
MLLVTNGNVITRDPVRPLINDGAVLIEDSKIKQIGKAQELAALYPAASVVDAHGGLIMPGLINMHNHIYSAFARGLSIRGYAPKGFLDILEGQWWKIDRTLNNQDNYLSAMTTYIDCIKNGVTTVFDHHASYGEIDGSLGAISEAADRCGVRTCLCYEISDRDGQDKMRAAVRENVRFIETSRQRTDDMQYGMMGMHAAFTLSDETLDYCRSQLPERTGYHIHVAEGLDDVYDSLHKYSKRIVNRLFDWGILGPETITAHCIHINRQERELLKETNTMVVHNPESNMGNAVGCPAVLDMVHEGIAVGLGTDGYTNDMLESYKVANILHKHYLCDPTVAWAEIPELLFVNNPQLANRYFKAPLGVLKAGAAADVIVMDYDPLTPLTEQNLNSHLLFGTNGRQVTDTIINGRVLMENRQLTELDETEIFSQARTQAADLWQRINA